MSITPHPFIGRLARTLLQKAERASGVSAVRLKVDVGCAPELFERVNAEQVQHYEALLTEFGECDWVTLHLKPAREFQTMADRSPMLELLDFDALASWVSYTPRRDEWARRFVRFLRTRPAVLPTQHADSGAIELPWESLADYLARSPLTALSHLEVEEAVRVLGELQRLCQAAEFMPLREASCRAFGGRSKVLDNREELMRLLGARDGQFFDAPIQLLADVPERMDDLLFIENLLTFEQMASHRQQPWEHSALVYSAGFRGSARGLRTPHGSQLYWRAGSEMSSARQRLVHWQQRRLELPISFFGDLDFAAMEILKHLRESCPNAVAWQAGYRVLEQALAGGHGHTPETADKIRQKDPGVAGCAYADETLLPLIRRTGRFVDQELFGRPTLALNDH